MPNLVSPLHVHNTGPGQNKVTPVFVLVNENGPVTWVTLYKEVWEQLRCIKVSKVFTDKITDITEGD